MSSGCGHSKGLHVLPPTASVKKSLSATSIVTVMSLRDRREDRGSSVNMTTRLNLWRLINASFPVLCIYSITYSWPLTLKRSQRDFCSPLTSFLLALPLPPPSPPTLPLLIRWWDWKLYIFQDYLSWDLRIITLTRNCRLREIILCMKLNKPFNKKIVVSMMEEWSIW